MPRRKRKRRRTGARRAAEQQQQEAPAQSQLEEEEGEESSGGEEEGEGEASSLCKRPRGTCMSMFMCRERLIDLADGSIDCFDRSIE